jgi:hypothetical protein
MRPHNKLLQPTPLRIPQFDPAEKEVLIERIRDTIELVRPARCASRCANEVEGQGQFNGRARAGGATYAE